MLGMTEASYEFASGVAANVYSDDSFEWERVRWAWPRVF